MFLSLIHPTQSNELTKSAARPGRGGGVLDISLGGEVWRGPSYPDPV